MRVVSYVGYPDRSYRAQVKIIPKTTGIVPREFKRYSGGVQMFHFISLHDISQLEFASDRC
jgi:hypothetical protein